MYPNIYGNQINKNQNQNQNQNKINNYAKNQNQNKQNGNQKNIPNKKYADLEIQTFFNNENNTGLSAKDMTLKNELETITNQYMATFNNINEISAKFAKGNDNIDTANKIQKDIELIEFENSMEYQNFIGQLFDVTKKGDVTNLSYDLYKKNANEGDQKLKKIIADYKYDLILFVGKNESADKYNKLRNYINEKNRSDYYYNNNNDNNKNNYNDNYGNNNNRYDNPNMGPGPAPSQNNNYNYQNNRNQNGNDYYSNYNNGGNYRNNYGNNNYDEYNRMNGEGYGNNYRQNYGNNDYNYNNYSSGKINVKFIVNGRTTYHEFDPNDSGEKIFWHAMDEKDNPKIYNKNGRLLTQDILREMKIKNIFAECEPVLNIC